MSAIQRDLSARQQIPSLQVFRGLAALAVVVHHAALSTDAFVHRLPVWAFGLFEFGLLGVDFFFVLSGFIIMHAHQGDARSPNAARSYAIKRLTRIFPAYLPIGIGVLVLYALLPGFLQQAGASSVGSVLSFCFLQMTRLHCQWRGRWCMS